MSENPFLSIAAPGDVQADLLVIGCCEGEAPPVEGLPGDAAAAIGRLTARPGWKGEEKQYVETIPDGGSVGAIGLLGLGARENLDARRTQRWITLAVEKAQHAGAGHLALRLPPPAMIDGSVAAERIARGAALAGYRFDRYLTGARRHEHRLGRLTLLPPDGDLGEYRQAVADAGPVASAVALTRDLANTPGNVADPAWMEAQARELADSRGMDITVLQRDDLERRGMGGLLAVGSGSACPPRLVRLEWGKGDRVIALVGKGITFDTGGISIKPATDLDEMKYDKAGACTVLGVAQAAADLDLPVRLRAYLPLAENMPDGSSYRPGDIVRCYNGKTVEIVNTDAEGRMILADALSWAAEEGPDVLLEYSTLTGASVVALGHHAAGLYTPDDELAQALLSAAGACGELLWRMPMWPEFLEQMKGNHADLKNSSSRWGSANTAAAFLSEFVGDLRLWAHFDIAGGAYISRDSDEQPSGATGYGVALTLHWLRRSLGDLD